MLRAILPAVLISCTLIRPLICIPSLEALPEGINKMHDVDKALPIDTQDPTLGAFGKLYRGADERLMVFDSQKTLRRGEWEGDALIPTRSALVGVCQDRKNTVAICSGLPPDMIQEYYGGIAKLQIYGEYGSTMIGENGQTVSTYNQPFIPVEDIGETIKMYINKHCEAINKGSYDNIPGHVLHQNKNTLLFGYDRPSKDKGKVHSDYQIEDLFVYLKRHIEEKYKDWGIEVTQSYTRGVIEFLPPNAKKGVLAQHLLRTQLQGGGKKLALSIGDGPLDESMHHVMNSNGHHSITVLTEPRETDKTYAHFYVQDVEDNLALLNKLAPQ